MLLFAKLHMTSFHFLSCFMFERIGQENKKLTFIENKNNVYFLENKEGFLVLMFILLRQYSSIDVNFQFENIFVNFKLSFMLCIHYIQYKSLLHTEALKIVKSCCEYLIWCEKYFI